MKSLFFAILLSAPLYGGQTTVQFAPTSPYVGPFPSNQLTVVDTAQKTGVRVQLPASFNNCDPQNVESVCSNTPLLNQLDGFSVNPRLMACFSAPIDASTLPSGLKLIPVAHPDTVIGVNQVAYEPNSHCAFAKPEQVLEQGTSYYFLILRSIQDADGKKIQQSQEYKDCRQQPGCDAVPENVAQALAKVAGDKIVANTVFTTLSATTWLEQARQYVEAHQVPALLPNGQLQVFSLRDVKTMRWIPQDNTGTSLNQADLPLTALEGVDSVAFGIFLTQNFLQISGPQAGTIPTTPTGATTPTPVDLPGLPPGGFEPVSFHIFLPQGPAPAGGFPVVLYGHGLGDSQFGAPTYMASALAKQGFATVALEITGHGFGANSFVQVTNQQGQTAYVPTPGRGIQLPNKSSIGSSDGCIAGGAIAIRDCARQTALDLSAFVRTLQLIQGFGLLNPARLYYTGQSLGATYGTLFGAIEPALRAMLLNGAGGPTADVARLAISGRPLGALFLSNLQPPQSPLLNVAAGLAPPQDYYHDAFNDGYVFRSPDAAEISNLSILSVQAAFEAAEWIGMLGDPLSFAPHLQKQPLPGVAPKPVLFQYGVGDLEVPNPTEAAVARAAAASASTWILHYEQAVQQDPDLLGVGMPGVPFPILPHRILSNPTVTQEPGQFILSQAEQKQAALFFTSDGQTIPDPNQFLTGLFTGSRLFTSGSLEEDLNFFQWKP